MAEEFVKADIAKLEEFATGSQEAIQEFTDIRDEFIRINNTLLNNWQGESRDAYKLISDNILEKVTGIQDVLNTINDSVVKDLIEQYNALDAELGDFNRHAGDPEEGAE